MGSSADPTVRALPSAAHSFIGHARDEGRPGQDNLYRDFLILLQSRNIGVRIAAVEISYALVQTIAVKLYVYIPVALGFIEKFLYVDGADADASPDDSSTLQWRRCLPKG